MSGSDTHWKIWARIAIIGICAMLPKASWSHEGSEHAAHAFGPIFPRLSDSSASIAFSYQGAIWRMGRDGGSMTRLTSGVGFDIEPAWSLDESRIAYIKSRNMFDGSLQVMQAADGSAIRLPREIVVRGKLFFNHSGERILGTFQDAGQNFVLAWLDLESGTLGEPIRVASSRQQHALSHDEKHVAYTTSFDEPGEQGGNFGPDADLWIVPTTGGEPERLIRFPARIYDLCWAADDQSLYVVTDLGGAHNDLWNIPLSDPQRGARKLTFGQADEDRPSVSADGRWLLMTDNRHGATALVLHDLKNNSSSWLEVQEMDYRQPTGRLHLQVTDAQTGEPSTARIAVQHEDGSYHAPPGALYRLLNGDMHFYLAGDLELRLPAGRYRIKAAHGPEYRITRCEAEIVPDHTTQVDVELKRWIDQPSTGWYSGENHIHANYGYGHWYNSPQNVLLQCAGEDLLVCNLMVANSDGDGVFDREFFRGRPDALSTDRTVLYWNQEFRSTIWGHMTLVNLKQLVEPIFTGFHHTTNPHDHPTNGDIADQTHDQGGHVNYTHPAQNPRDPYEGAYTAKALPLDVARGKIDSIDVMGSNHVANLPLWYRLLNCGFRIPASAGTDCFLNRIPSQLPGADRVYVKIDGDFEYQRWIDQLRAGRTFVTNGPMLELSVNELMVGETLVLDDAAEVKCRCQVRSQFPIDTVELIYNGQVAAQLTPGADKTNIDVERSLGVDRSGWIALRVSGARQSDQPRGDVFAHTSPVYVEIQDRPIDAREDAEYFLQWIDRLWEAVRRRDRIPTRQRADVESQIFEARAVYARLAGRIE